MCKRSKPSASGACRNAFARRSKAIAAKLGVPQHTNSWLRYEIDALTDQQPTGRHGIAALLVQIPGVDLTGAYDDLRADVVALEITRDRIARHYADFEALWRHPSRAEALARLDLLEDVVRHKSRFFASGWTQDVQARATGGAPCCLGAGLCDDGADVHWSPDRGRCHVAPPGSGAAAAQRRELASARVIVFRVQRLQ